MCADEHALTNLLLSRKREEEIFCPDNREFVAAERESLLDS